MIGIHLFNLIKSKFTRNEIKTIFLASLGSGLVFYDFTVFGLYAIYFAPQIFPAHSNLSSIACVYIVFALSFMLKPVGIFFSQYFINKSNPRHVLILTALIISLASFAMGLIPKYADIGILSGLLMLIFRFIQGFAAGAEEQGMIKYLHDNLQATRSHLSLSGIFLGTEIGGIFALTLNQILTYSLSYNQIESWGWRIPFIIGGMLSILFYYFRYKFKTIKHPEARDRLRKFNLFTILRRNITQILILASIIGLASTLWINCIIYMPIVLYYHLGLSYQAISSLIIHATIYAIIAASFISLIAKKVAPVKLLKFSLYITIIAIIYSYHCLAIKQHIALAINILIILHGIINRLLLLVFINKLFPLHNRLAGVSLGVNTGYTLFGVFSPLIIVVIMSITNTYFIAISSYIIIVTLISLIGLHYFVKVKS